MDKKEITKKIEMLMYLRDWMRKYKISLVASGDDYWDRHYLAIRDNKKNELFKTNELNDSDAVGGTLNVDELEKHIQALIEISKTIGEG